MDKFYVTLHFGEGSPSHIAYRAEDMSHALQRITDFVAGMNFGRTTKHILHVDSISLKSTRGIAYEEGWL